MKQFLILAALAACGGADDLCGRLGEAPSCGGNAEALCQQAISDQNDDTPACADELDRLVACAGELREVGCSGSDSAFANGDGQFEGPTNFAIVGGFHLVVNDSACDVHKRAYDDCAGNQ